MEEEKTKEELRIELLAKIPNRYKQLKRVLATRSFSEEELIRLNKTATEMNLTLANKLKKKKFARQRIFGIFPTHP